MFVFSYNFVVRRDRKFAISFYQIFNKKATFKGCFLYALFWLI